MRGGIGDEEQLVARVRAEAGEQVVRFVERDRRAELLERGCGDVGHEGAKPFVLRVHPRLARSHRGVRLDEAREQPPEQLVGHANRGRTVSANVRSSSDGKVYEEKWRM